MTKEKGKTNHIYKNLLEETRARRERGGAGGYKGLVQKKKKKLLKEGGFSRTMIGFKRARLMKPYKKKTGKKAGSIRGDNGNPRGKKTDHNDPRGGKKTSKGQ